jgi:hypothetical protein
MAILIIRTLWDIIMDTIRIIIMITITCIIPAIIMIIITLWAMAGIMGTCKKTKRLSEKIWNLPYLRYIIEKALRNRLFINKKVPEEEIIRDFMEFAAKKASSAFLIVQLRPPSARGYKPIRPKG